MTFTVVCTPSAEKMLAHLWNVVPDQTLVSQAANAIDAMLHRDSLGVGDRVWTKFGSWSSCRWPFITEFSQPIASCVF